VKIHVYRSVRELEAQLAGGSDRALVCDAICMACRRNAPLRALQQLARRSRSWLVVDDSQGVGLLGARPTPAMPYGRGGGGTLRWSEAEREHVIMIASLAKAFAAPLAFLAGSRSTVEWFERHAETRVHASPCNAAALAAAGAALRANMERGDTLRAQLVAGVRRFREAVAEQGGTLSPGMFPVQATVPAPVAVVRVLDEALRRRGVRAVRLRPRAGLGQLGFLINADHDPTTLARAGALVGHVIAVSSRLRRPLVRAARPDGAEAHAP
jgi:8-amino-7-oxononanoate synthase